MKYRKLLLISALTALPVLADSPQRLGENNPLVPPYIHIFDDYRAGMEREDFARYFEVIDANNDGRSWGYYNYSDETYSKCAYLLYPIEADRADDWLITQATRLQGGKWYRVSMDPSLYQEGPTHCFEVKYGLYNDPDGMDMPVIPATDVTSSKRTFTEGWICPPYDAVYYIGIHAVSTDHSGYLFMDNIAVSAPHEGSVPGAATDIVAVNDPDGAPTATFTFKAPEKTLDGQPLTGTMRVEMSQDGMPVKTFNNVNPGEELTCSDSPGAKGDYRYTILASNDNGEGREVIFDFHVGLTAPTPPAVTGFEEIDGDHVRLTWATPATDTRGCPINPDAITYIVYDASHGEPVELARDLTQGEYVFAHGTPEDSQQLLLCLVTATVAGETSAYSPSEFLTVGAPYELPYLQSFSPSDFEKYLLSVDSSDPNITWKALDDFSDPKSQDGDNGYLAMEGAEPGKSCEFQTGKISLYNSECPGLSFWLWYYEDDMNELRINVYDQQTGEKEEAAFIPLSRFNRVGWNRVFISLEDFAGKIVRIGFEGTIKTHGYLPIDNIRLQEMPATDLTLLSLSAPRYAQAGEQYVASVQVTNSGSKPSPKATLILERDGKAVATQEIPVLASMETAELTIPDTLTPAGPDYSNLIAVITVEGDANPEDNYSTPVTISRIGNNHPTPQNLEGTDRDGTVTLHWQAPDMSLLAPAQQTEDFESYQPFSANPGQWLTIDRDGGLAGGFVDLPTPIDGTPQSFWVQSTDAPYDFLDCTSGKQFLAQMYARSDDGRSAVQCDDWLISPELYGGRQTISFQASSLSTEYGYDTFEIYWSEGSTDPSAFHMLQGATEPTAMWEKFFFTLPAGAKRFALRCTSMDTYMLMLDDFTYVPAGTPIPLQHTGYNVYCNGKQINQDPVTDTSYTTLRTAEHDSYAVTALYDKGESMAAPEVSFGNTNTLPGLESEATAPAELFTTQGLRLSSGSRPAPGIYLRRQGPSTTKVIIR